MFKKIVNNNNNDTEIEISPVLISIKGRNISEIEQGNIIEHQEIIDTEQGKEDVEEEEEEEKNEKKISGEEEINNELRNQGWNVICFLPSSKNEYKSTFDQSKLYAKHSLLNRLPFLIIISINEHEEYSDYLNLIETIKKINKKAKVYFCNFYQNKYYQIAYKYWCPILDSYKSLSSILINPPNIKKQFKKTRLVGISGPSHSGKSTLALNLSKNYENSIVINQDRYFDVDYIKENCKYNWDLPEGIRHNEFIDHIKDLINEGTYDYIFVEGFMIYFDIGLASLFDCRFWFNSDLNTCSTRRLKTQRMTIQYYTDTVWPNHLSYTEHVFDYSLDIHGWSSPIILDSRLSRESIFNYAAQVIDNL
eukprot:TRINITY_DN2598_c0_g1_i1.p1 TRINITY_DN2598_c0_g1~~TRINITY_DN2598_c0_g1_i1.p1  ORF type:complete len:364 (+),score=65.01 TRINITY_DN2598_c0_g1_i1:35-1126(+)